MGSRLYRISKASSDKTVKKVQTLSGYLGIIVNGEETVEVANRPGFHWVRLRNVNNEIIQAANYEVSPVYNMPVLVERDPHMPDRYKVVGRDIGTYGSNWGSISSFEPKHAGQHMFIKNNGATGGDIVWVYSDQFMPFLVAPSGTYNAANAVVHPYVYHVTGTYHYAGGTGTPNIVDFKPLVSGSARMVLLYLDTATGNPKIAAGLSGTFSDTITGTAGVLPYIPAVPTCGIALAGVRLVSGTSTIGWKNLYDIREFVHKSPGTVAGGGGGGVENFVDLSDVDSPFGNDEILYWGGAAVEGEQDLRWIDTTNTLRAGSNQTWDAASENSLIFGRWHEGGGGDNNAVLGYGNVLWGDESTITGDSNSVSGTNVSVLGGYGNEVVGTISSVLSGDSNLLIGDESVILGGYGNIVEADFATAGGSLNNVTHNGAILFSAGDYTNDAFDSVAEDEFAVKAVGGFRVVTAVDGAGAPTKTASIDSNGDMKFVGSGTGMPYGSMYTNDAIARTLTTQNTWYEVDAAQAWTTGLLNLCTFTDPYIVVTVAGTYLINWSLSGQVNATNQGIGGGIMLDQTTIQNPGQARTMFLNAARNLTFGGTAILTLTANQKVSLAVRNVTSSGKIFTVQKGNLTLTMIGG